MNTAVHRVTRVIPRLDIKGPNLVKGINLEGLRVLGKPAPFARAYYEEGADELMLMDIVASLYGRNNLLDLIEQTANEVFIPIVVGGGLRTTDDLRAVLRAGADKVTINTAAVGRPEFIKEAADLFGASTIVVSIEAMKLGDGKYEAFTDNGRERTGLEVEAWAVKAAELGAGEILITSIEREGTGRGYDLELTRRICRAVDVPVIACGGAGTTADVLQAIDVGASAVSLASMFHYDAVKRLPRERSDFAAEINLQHLDRPGFRRIQATGIGELKSFLEQNGVTSRRI